MSEKKQVIIGELLGAGRTVDTNKKVKQTALISLCASTTIAILFFILSNYAFKIFDVYDLVWNEPYSGDYNVVMRHICNIREKIEDDPGQPLYIQTVRGVGYRFNGNLGSE